MPIWGVLKHFVEDFKLQFIFLIGGRVFNPRQQQNVVNICLCSRAKRL